MSVLTKIIPYPRYSLLTLCLILLFVANILAIERLNENDELYKSINPSDSEIKAIYPVQSDFDIQIWTDRKIYYIGEDIRIYFRANRDAYVYIYNTDAAGFTRLIFPNYYDSDNFIRAHHTYVIPDYRYSLKIIGPAGREELEIVAVRSRVYFYERYYRFSPDEPFPKMREGARGLINELQKQNEATRSRQRTEEPKSSRERESKAIVPVPRPQPLPPLPYEYATDSTSIYVRGGYWVPDYDHWRPPFYPAPDYWRRGAGFGYLIIRSKPEQANIYIDGDYKGKTPKTLLLPVGTYRVVLSKSGYLDWTERIRIERGERQYIYADLDRERPRTRRTPFPPFWKKEK